MSSVPPPPRVWSLGTGSQGNCIAVAFGEHVLLLDAGFELPVLAERLQRAGLHPWFVEEVVLTHGHRDHVLGAAAGAAHYGWRVWASLGTVWRWRALRGVAVAPFRPGDAFDAGPFRVRTAATSHDVDDSAALVVEIGGARIGFATDLGEASPAVVDLLRGCDLLLLEANHDPARLAAGPYPPEVRARVAGPTGHLSNAQAAAVARAVAHAELGAIVLVHVSRHNNTPALALQAVGDALRGTAFRGALLVAPQDDVLALPAPGLTPRG